MLALCQIIRAGCCDCFGRPDGRRRICGCVAGVCCAPEAAAVAATGQRSYWPVIVALIAAVVLIVLCIIIPKVSKKK